MTTPHAVLLADDGVPVAGVTGGEVLFARSTSINGRPDRLDDAVRYVEEDVRRAMDGLDGWLGVACLVDRVRGRSIVISTWEDEGTVERAGGALRVVTEGAEAVFGGRARDDDWEVALRETRATGTCCRLTWGRADVGSLVAEFRSNSLPSLQELPGFCGATVMVKRPSGIACVVASYDRPEALDSSQTSANRIRTRVAEQAAREVFDVRVFDLAYTRGEVV